MVADAMVTDIQPQDYNTVFCSFMAGGVTYSSGGPSDAPNPAASELAVGDGLYVVFDATDRLEHRMVVRALVGERLENVPVLHDLALVVQPEEVGRHRSPFVL